MTTVLGWVLLVISPYSKVNYVDQRVTDQTSILQFIEDNWEVGRIGNQSMDAQSGSILNMFDFSYRTDKLFLNPNNGTILSEFTTVANTFPSAQ